MRVSPALKVYQEATVFQEQQVLQVLQEAQVLQDPKGLMVSRDLLDRLVRRDLWALQAHLGCLEALVS